VTGTAGDERRLTRDPRLWRVIIAASIGVFAIELDFFAVQAALPDMARDLLDRKVTRIAETGARVVAAANPGCLLQIASGCRERGLDVALVHPVELLARAADAYQG